MEKILGFLGFEEEPENSFPDPAPPPPRLVKNNVVNLPSGRPVRFVIARPTAFEQAADIADYLRERQPVLLNFEGTEVNTARRVLDFLGGVAYALGATVHKINDGIFVIVPSSMEITYPDGSDKLLR